MTVYEVVCHDTQCDDYYDTTTTVAWFADKQDAEQCVRDFKNSIDEDCELTINEYNIISAGKYRRENIDTDAWWYEPGRRADIMTKDEMRRANLQKAAAMRDAGYSAKEIIDELAKDTNAWKNKKLLVDDIVTLEDFFVAFGLSL